MNEKRLIALGQDRSRRIRGDVKDRHHPPVLTKSAVREGPIGVVRITIAGLLKMQVLQEDTLASLGSAGQQGDLVPDVTQTS